MSLNFGDDPESKAAQESVIASLLSELGKERVEVLPAGIQLRLTDGVSMDIAADEAGWQAGSLLKKRNGDL